MRPRIVEFLNVLCNTQVFTYLVPSGPTIYLASVITVALVFIKRCERTGLSASHALYLSIFTAMAAALGSRIFYLLQHMPSTLANPLVIFYCGGTTSWGAYLGGIGFFVFYLFIKNIPICPYLDVLGSSLGLGPFIGRWSCFMNGCCFGSTTNVPWSIRFPKYSQVYQLQVRNDLIDYNSSLSEAVHPVQLYESLATLAIFLILSWFWKKNRDRPGLTFLTYVLMYCITRFGIEFFRGDVGRYSPLNLTVSQFMCLIIISASILFWILGSFKLESE
jgi:phosphatidylglycerol:prolipoprotein diacylglycerol transferase